MDDSDDGARPASDTGLVEELLPQETTLGGHRVSRGSRWRRGVGNALMAFGALTGLLAVAYLADVIVGFGDVPRGVTVAGVDIGGLGKDDAQAALRRELGSLVTRLVTVRAGDAEAPLDPAGAGLGVDWAATVARAGAQPWLPWERLGALFGGRELPLVTTVDEQAARAELSRVARERLNRPAVDGGIAFRNTAPQEGHDDGGVVPQAIEPRFGTEVSDLDAAVAALKEHWPRAPRIDVPVRMLRPKLTSEAVHTALEETVRPLLSGPILLRGDGADSVLLPEDVRKALGFEIRDGAGGASLEVTLDHAVLSSAVLGELGTTERRARDAALVFRNGIPVVVPSVRGTRIDWERTFAGMARTVSQAREVTVHYNAVEPAVTTGDVRALGIEEVLATASAHGHSPEDIAAVDVAGLNGIVVKPGETFEISAHATATPLERVLREALHQAGLSVDEGRAVNDTGNAVAVHAAVSGSTITATVWGTG
ncbi:peptidoglycan binding domain-containing protein [Saccharomonospora xinjiangensis]|uniref:peptidoglycan binding domain-containing protein n=1 Tax=Saccharomonospora xinjiangensis TaxID=75294 RepID=UPI00106F570B|nr:peptidoglycan binding domain-containing protein [Saccharomonospora xinjiangensis]QBQ62633.1 hypothetical protein EYD13_21530 [Saccharomonospora xinjiangensis]